MILLAAAASALEWRKMNSLLITRSLSRVQWSLRFNSTKTYTREWILERSARWGVMLPLTASQGILAKVRMQKDDFHPGGEELPTLHPLWENPRLTLHLPGEIHVDPQRYTRIVLERMIQELTPPPRVGFLEELLKKMAELTQDHQFDVMKKTECRKSFLRWLDTFTGRLSKCEHIKIPL